MSALAQSLVGRDTELDLLDRLLDGARSGSPRFAVICGEPGIGKTSLLGELVRRAEDGGCLALEGRAAELEQELPFGLVVDAFDAYLESLEPRAYERLAADDLGELASVFPALRSLRSGSDRPGTSTERFRAHHAVRELIERLAARQPVVLALDDVHWSDGASIELIAHLLRRRPEAAVLMVVTFRTAQAPPTLAATLDSAEQAGVVERLELGPLPSDDARELLSTELATDAERLYRESGGNPFYLLQLARGTPRGNGAQQAGRDGSVPRAVSAAISAELDSLSEPTRAFAQAAAVAGDPFELDLASATADMSEAAALTALDELFARDLVRPAEIPRLYRFRHPLVRSAIYGACSPGVKIAAHSRAAEELAARGAPATSRAHHVEQCARHGDEQALAVLREAGRATAERAPSSAAGWLAAALRIMPSSQAPAERAELLASLAAAYAATGRLEESHAALLETIQLIPEDESLRLVWAISTCAAVEQILGRHEDAHHRLEKALSELPDEDSLEGASLMIELAWDAGLEESGERMMEWGTKALETARPLGDGPLTASAAAICGLAASWTGDVELAEERRAEAVALVDALPDETLARRPHCFQWLSASEYFLDRFDDAIAHAERGLGVARAGGQGQLMPGMTQAVGMGMTVTGRLAEGAEFLDGAVDGARLTGNVMTLCWSLGSRCYSATMEGDVDTALATGEEALALAEQLGSNLVTARVSVAMGTALVLAGQPARAVHVMVEGAGGEDLPLVPSGWKGVGLDALTRAQLALGEQAAAERAAATAEELAALFEKPYTRSFALRAGAAVMLARREAGEAAQRALGAAEKAEQVGARVDAAFARILAGQALTEAGDKERAALELERAATELEACGALRHRNEAERALRQLGRTIHRRTRRGRSDGDGVGSLTGRELEIAQLVVGRRTNPEIAAELFLSIKTVETHLRNIFRKLDVDSRVEVARVVERSQL